MVMHLLVNASLLDSAATFQSNVYRIHRFGGLLWVVEWVFIFLPLMFHGILGLLIIRGGLPNVSSYPYAANVRYTAQRVTGIIALLFISWHVFHMHGWFHFDIWLRTVARPLAGSLFRPFNAASSVSLGMQGVVVPTLYAIGILACVIHLANGIWTMGITWGVWTTPGAQRRANGVCVGIGLVVAVLGLAALAGTQIVDLDKALESERRMVDVMLEHEEIKEDHIPHKSWAAEDRAANEELDEALKRLEVKEELDAIEGE
jgi:succinate dehydrogenase / fumarate reductase cytochrome b subunit